MRINLRPGEPIFGQVVFAAQKAILSGEFKAGQPFPSVRSLATELHIHPNTAHKVIQHLIQQHWLEARPGVGTVVGTPPPARRGERKRLLEQEVEELLVEAKRVGVSLHEVVQAISAKWIELERASGGTGE